MFKKDKSISENYKALELLSISEKVLNKITLNKIPDKTKIIHKWQAVQIQTQYRKNRCNRNCETTNTEVKRIKNQTSLAFSGF